MKRTTVVWSPYDKVSRLKSWSIFSTYLYTQIPNLSSLGTRQVCIGTADVFSVCIQTEVRESRRNGAEDSSVEKISWLFLCVGDNKGATGNLSKMGFWAVYSWYQALQVATYSANGAYLTVAPRAKWKTHFCNTCAIKHLSTIFTFSVLPFVFPGFKTNMTIHNIQYWVSPKYFTKHFTVL